MPPLHRLTLGNERDVVSARQRARSIAELLGYDHHDQIRIATAVSEIARNAFRYARGGAVTYSVDPEQRIFRVDVEDQGAGIPHLEKVMNGSYRSTTGMGMGILGTKRLMDQFSIETTSRGTVVRFGKLLPNPSESLDINRLGKVAAELARQHPASPIEELQTQNAELLKTLNDLKERKEELLRTNAELEDTNRGVVALYAELDERADYLRRTSDMKTSFLSNMSHEFRTPLNSMLALARMLLDRIDGDLTSEQEQQVRFIQQSARELAEMVDDLLDLAKVEAGRLEVKPKQFLIQDLFSALRGMLKPLLAESSLSLVFEDVAGLPPLDTDEQKISQVLRNFISNAIKFTPRGEVRVAARLEGDNVTFAVSDTGIGISGGDLEVIFEEFAQVDSAMQKRVKGTGLGLPLSRKLARLMGGAVRVESQPGVGSTFLLTVPVVYGGSLRSEEPPLPARHAEKPFVLIVEDNPETSFIYARYLLNVGLPAHVVSSVAAAKKVLETARPAAIILDLMLRAENTWDFLRELKAVPDPIPVLVVSVSDDQRKIFGLGADANLTKPFVPEEMIAQVMRLISTASRPRILIIDDSEVARYLLRGSISEALYDIFEAREGREGLRMALELKPTVIFLDFYMSDLNGAQVLRDLRSIPELMHTPVILHSTKDLDEQECAFYERNSVEIFAKQSLAAPDGVSRLNALLETLTSHASLEAKRG